MQRPDLKNTSPMTTPSASGRSGVAAVEFAVCLPVLMAFVFGVIESTNAVFLKEALTAAAYETANCASAIGGTSAVAIQRGNGVLGLLGVQSASVNVTPAVTTNTTTGTTIVVTCSAPLSANTQTGWCLGKITISAKVTISHL